MSYVTYVVKKGRRREEGKRRREIGDWRREIGKWRLEDGKRGEGIREKA
jgi:hypothetical protein